MQNQYSKLERYRANGITVGYILVVGFVAIALIFAFAAINPRKASIAIAFALAILFFITFLLD